MVFFFFFFIEVVRVLLQRFRKRKGDLSFFWRRQNEGGGGGGIANPLVTIVRHKKRRSTVQGTQKRGVPRCIGHKKKRRSTAGPSTSNVSENSSRERAPYLHPATDFHLFHFFSEAPFSSLEPNAAPVDCSSIPPRLPRKNDFEKEKKQERKNKKKKVNPDELGMRHKSRKML